MTEPLRHSQPITQIAPAQLFHRGSTLLICSFLVVHYLFLAGVAVFNGTGGTREEGQHNVDKTLYQAKRNGRNRAFQLMKPRHLSDVAVLREMSRISNGLI